jgi:hypothetical protein
MYGLVQIGSAVMIWVICSTDVASVMLLGSSSGACSSAAPERIANVGFLVVGLVLMDLSKIVSKKTPGGIGRHFDPMLAKSSASTLLSLPTCQTSQPSKSPSSRS